MPMLPWIAFWGMLLALPGVALARDDGRWAGSRYKAWYESAQLTVPAQKRFGFKGCCAHSDVVRTRFQVSHQDGADQWWWLDRGTWKQVPADIIHWGETAPDGQPTLFLLGGSGEPTCFYPGESGN